MSLLYHLNQSSSFLLIVIVYIYLCGFFIRNSQTILKAHRDYINFTSKYCKPRFRPSRRGNIYRSFINILVQSHRQNSYFPPPLSNIPSEFSDSQSGVDQFTIAWRAEWAQLLTQYEKHLSYTDAKNFPRAGTVNKPILDLVDRAYEGWRVSGSLTDDASRLAQVNTGLFLFKSNIKGNPLFI